MATVYLGLGTNLGNKEAHLQYALEKISVSIGYIKSSSAVYQSEAWGYQSDNRFLNMVVCTDTELAPDVLLNRCKSIEQSAGRKNKKNEGYADRVLDVDILYYDALILRQAKLSIPHPLIAERRFVLQPLCDIASTFVDPVQGTTVNELLSKCKDHSSIQKVETNIKLPD